MTLNVEEHWSVVTNNPSISDVSDMTVTATGGSTARTLSDWFSGTGRSPEVPPDPTHFWSDTPTVGNPDSIRINRRVFIGQAVDTDDTRLAGGSHQTDWGSYANWMPRESDFVVMAQKGTLAISALARTSDKAGLSPTPSTWALGGYVLNDLAGGFARALYLETQKESGAGGTPAIEIVAKNKADDRTTSPYFPTGAGVDGIWLIPGGDVSYGGAPTNPSNTGIHFKTPALTTSAYRWNKGIVFDAQCLTGTDGADADTATATAIELAKQQQISWLRPNNAIGGYIKSTVNNAGLGGGIRFDADYTLFTDAAGNVTAAVQSQVGQANYLNLQAVTAGNPVVVQASGTDTDIAIRFAGKGAAGIRFKNDVVASAFAASPSVNSSGRVFTNEAATALTIYTLPPTAVGVVMSFCCMDADGVRVVAPSGSVIRVGASVSASGGRVDSTVVGSFVELVAVNATTWVAKFSTGTWTVT